MKRSETIIIDMEDGETGTWIVGRPKFKHRNMVSTVLKGMSSMGGSSGLETREKMKKLAAEKKCTVEDLVEKDLLSDDEKISLAEGGNVSFGAINDVLEPLLLCTLISTPSGPVKGKTDDEIKAELDELDYGDVMQLFQPALNFVIGSLTSMRKKKESLKPSNEQ